MIFASETWAQVEGEFDDLGRRNFEECGIADGKRPYGLHHGILNTLSETGNVHVTTARDEGRLVGYILSIISQRHIMYDTCVSQVLGMYLLPEYRQGNNGLNLMKSDEDNMKRLGVHKMDGGFTISKDLLTLFKRRGWSPAETAFTKWID